MRISGLIKSRPETPQHHKMTILRGKNAYGEVEGGHCFICPDGTGRVLGVSASSVWMQSGYEYNKLQYVVVSVLPFSGWFFTCSRARLYKNMEEENTIFMGETLRCLVGPHWEPEVMDFFPPGWLYSGRGWSVTPVFETEGVVSGR